MWLTLFFVGLIRLLLGATPRFSAELSPARQYIFFANHTSHIDTLALWSALPLDVRAKARPVAALDYWGKSAVRRYVALDGLNCVLIDRNKENSDANPLDPLMAALAQGDSLIIFPEGTRQTQALPGPFKSGLFHLAEAFPDVDLVPVYLENLHRSMPKGSFFPVPVTCAVSFGPVLPRIAGEDKADFLERARRAITELA